ncbi:hypothetical protein [Streptomyces kanamyceticus]|uniref:hypothetical protein n=1 Tax=Streptomyces kanamyceticus TaxID=1967 RepID=UPI0037DC1FA6
MRIRHALATATLGMALALGALAVPAQAAQSGVSGATLASPQADRTGSSGELTAAAWQWVYSGSYPSRSACDAVANDLYYNYNIRGQCRGPYSGGRFDLHLWLNR